MICYPSAPFNGDGDVSLDYMLGDESDSESFEEDEFDPLEECDPWRRRRRRRKEPATPILTPPTTRMTTLSSRAPMRLTRACPTLPLLPRTSLAVASTSLSVVSSIH